MRFDVTRERVNVNSFAVCLIKVPQFPIDPDNLWGIVRTPLMAVVGAVLDENGWSFTNLSKEEKHIIGDSLWDQGAKTNEWWWCTQYDDTQGESDE